MTKKARLIILGSCIVLFFAVTPYMVLYSLGYRVNLAHFTVVATGGMYVKALPEPNQVFIDSQLASPSGLLSQYVFLQNMLPGSHAVQIKKEGYYDYQKTLLVKEREATKLEHVSLIKKYIPFTLVDNATDYGSLLPNGNFASLKLSGTLLALVIFNSSSGQKNTTQFPLENQYQTITGIDWSKDSNTALLHLDQDYFLLKFPFQNATLSPLTGLSGAQQISFYPQNASRIFFVKNKNLYAIDTKTPLANNTAAYYAGGNSITYLSYDGFLYETVDGSLPKKLTSTVFPIKKGATYALFQYSQTIFLQENQSLLLLNPTTHVFENFYPSVTTLQTSPDNQKLLLCSDQELLLSQTNNPQKIIPLNEISGHINSCWWLGDNYILALIDGATVLISEVDYRGNINTVQFQPNLNLGGSPDNLVAFLNAQDKKLYLRAGKKVFSSEKLIP